ncbi:MAG: family 10 glycosylhydrolase [Planctomycetes bacterium]|nr:family 10 glycosylhydrolase [Planctomycetota bacterium]
MRWLQFALLPLAAGCAVMPEAPGLERCVWVSRFEYSSQQDIERIVRESAAAGVTAVMFQVRGNGTVYYHSGHELWSEKYGFRAPGFDPLAVAIESARRHGVELHAWINVVPGWRGDITKADPGQLVRSRPAWFVSDANGPIPLESGYYWLDVDNPSARAYLAELCRELAQNYSIDGLHLDHIRCASGHGSVDGVTELVHQIQRAVRTVARPVELSAAVFADPVQAKQKVGQDWPTWAERGYVDVLFPMNYTEDDRLFRDRVRLAVASAGDVPVIAGVGVYKHLSARQSAYQCRTAIDAGAAGVCLFSYGALRDRGPASFRRVVEAVGSRY